MTVTSGKLVSRRTTRLEPRKQALNPT
jgi:hypothetical protein